MKKTSSLGCVLLKMHAFQSIYGNRNITRFCETDRGNIMVSEWMKNFLFGLGFGILVETLIFLSPLFETTLWETVCTFVKVIPFVTLYSTAIIGVILMGISVFLKKKRKP